MNALMTRRLGSSKTPAIGMGCWAIGGPFWAGTQPLAQGALGWIWARSPQTIPIPGFRTVKQVEENVAALRLGPLTEDEIRQIAELLRW
ncbi:MAG: aldo/keto reductase [Verrucomicrobia bacterium]|nr:aldo/keto reductase [Verrucomicrobiota bacterium]